MSTRSPSTILLHFSAIAAEKLRRIWIRVGWTLWVAENSIANRRKSKVAEIVTVKRKKEEKKATLIDESRRREEKNTNLFFFNIDWTDFFEQETTREPKIIFNSLVVQERS